MAWQTLEWRRALLWTGVATAGVVGVVAAVGLFLFSGSKVSCAEERRPRGLALRCALGVAATPEEVWRAFVTTDEPRPYYFDAVLQAELRPGGRWRFVTDDLERLLAGGEVLVVDPPRRFAHTFEAADLDDPPSRIRVAIEPIPGGTRVELIHDGFLRPTRTFQRFRRAHPLALTALKAWVETGELPLRARLYTALFKPGMKTFTVRAEPWVSGRPAL